MLEHLSASSIDTLDRCELQWYFRYVEGKKIPPAGAMVRGSGYHKAVERNFRQKVSTKEDLPAEELKQDFSDYFDHEIAEAQLREDENVGELKDSGVKLVEVFRASHAPTITPRLVEYDTTVVVADFPFQVRMDLVTESDEIRDNKTASKSPGDDAADKSTQLTAYDLAYRKQFGTAPKSLHLDVAVSKKTPEIVVKECAPRTPTQLAVFEDEVGLKLKAISAGVFKPCSADSWACSKKWCGYYEICKFGKRRKG
jgi:putative RecB family exonuclease